MYLQINGHGLNPDSSHVYVLMQGLSLAKSVFGADVKIKKAQAESQTANMVCAVPVRMHNTFSCLACTALLPGLCCTSHISCRFSVKSLHLDTHSLVFQMLFCESQDGVMMWGFTVLSDDGSKAVLYSDSKALRDQWVTAINTAVRCRSKPQYLHDR